MKRNGTVLIVIIGVVSLMIYAGARLSRQTAAQSGGAPPEEASSLKAGSTAPDFELKTVDGKPVKLSSYRGKAVLLNFWATWCGPCKIETPWLVDFYKQYQPNGLEIVGIAMDSEHDEIPKFVKDMNINYTILEGTEKVSDAYGGLSGFPVTFFIDRNGKIVNVVYGLRSHSDLEDDIKKALAAPAQTASAAGPAGK
ncbi:MAG TPA: TlpA disulfide reductase family protein [Terriglobales bacterium]|nr:TlpA disulfide reductase family protein [Terriglobales bacterium]